MYQKRVEIRIRKRAVEEVLNRRYQEPLDKNITREEVICPSCGFKARYQFVRCPECEAVRKGSHL